LTRLQTHRLELIERGILVKLTREPNQMNSVFIGLSWSRREA